MKPQHSSTFLQNDICLVSALNEGRDYEEEKGQNLYKTR